MPDNKEAARGIMQEAAKQIFKFSEDLIKFSIKFSGPPPIRWVEYERLSEKLRGNISNALEKTHEMAGKLEADLNIENALTAFRVGREAYCLLFLGRMGYPKTAYKEMVEGLLVDIKKIRYYTTELAEKIENEGDKRLLYDLDKKEELWVSVLQALSDNNMDKVQELLFTELQRLSPEDNVE